MKKKYYLKFNADRKIIHIHGLQATPFGLKLFLKVLIPNLVAICRIYRQGTELLGLAA